MKEHGGLKHPLIEVFGYPVDTFSPQAKASIFMDQTTLFDIDKIVNVAKVSQRSPFRYPGGKTWLVPWARGWLKSLSRRPAVFVEPFCGGGIISLTAAFENLADHIVMVELDDQIASVWKVILGSEDDRKWLANRITDFKLSHETACETLNETPQTIRDKAFQTILKNRVYHGGILAEGSGMIKNGENGKGISSRWYPETLKKRILDIGKVAEKITFIEGDGMEALRRYADADSAAFFIDPPYTAGGKKAGRRLYRFCDLNHQELFHVASSLKGDFLMTYDDAQEVRELAISHEFDTHYVPMKGTHHIACMELLVGRNLMWARPREIA